ncbi:Transcription factor IIIB 90 kDa subunit, putative [Perkinsus marinus ATCC 50983]|uniref:B-related factor 1 n=1 Tax=Perkinsus marinus (strain ATCC 50983 / TXsc) TaxID=423536 RepID=C5KZL6_PERM5|nr:Transcription factor IIIB 90 kDa subunit, putative [Perkinsus marinus ATCC 50983]EER10044.1 Transcription factor IIIB 90 kDa subunit, putative [Perkinsus marinus ATCC 50983]|eukprot:XP_002778249.1 Transcription factor IIIB 90 kDa subunit, putative [Perkinsus marinus ATCC 50983]
MDSRTGQTVCLGCGEVLEENRVVCELSFTQSGDRTGVNGQSVPWLGGGGRRGGYSSENSRLLTLQRGSTRIEWIGNRLELPTSTMDEAKRLFSLAAQRNFTAGRKTSVVAAACLYIVCRRDRTPYLLIDFSDVLHVSVREIGQMYMKLVRLLSLDKVLDIPVIDPSMFMERFSSHLGLGDKQNQVVHTAIRLIQLMSRDWICTGRRPTGLCGAALLIAARYHGVENVTANSVAGVVRIGAVTLKRRLYELKHTPTAALTTEQFKSLENAPDPADGSLPGGDSVQEAGAHGQLQMALPEEARATTSLPPSLMRNRIKEEKMKLLGLPLKDESKIIIPVKPLGTQKSLENGEREVEHPQLTDITHHDAESSQAKPSSSSSSTDPTAGASEGDLPELDELYNALRSTATSGVESDGELIAKLDTVAGRTTAASDDADPTSLLEEDAKQNKRPLDDDEESISDVSDSEIEGYLLTPEESEAKSAIWHQWNKPYLMEWAIRDEQRKAKKRAEDEAKRNGTYKPRKRPVPSTAMGPADSALEATQMALSKKARSLSNRVNMSALEELFKT